MGMRAASGLASALLSLAVMQAPVPKPSQPLQPASPAGPDVEVGIRISGEPGSPVHWAGVGGSDAAGYAWLESPCAPNAGNEKPLSAPRAGWRFTTAVVNRDGDFVSVNVTWYRQWSAQPPSDAARIAGATSRTYQLVMHAGDRVEIDRLPPEDTASCAGEVARLEATLTSDRPAGSGRSAPGRAGAASPAALVSSELWLVHTLPNGTEEFRSTTVRFDSTGTPFGFPAFEIATPHGLVVVTVSGTVGATMTSGVPTALTLVINRAVVAPDRPPSTRALGTAQKALPWPKGDAVTSFELPAVAGPAADDIAGHQFALRVRVTATMSAMRKK